MIDLNTDRVAHDATDCPAYCAICWEEKRCAWRRETRRARIVPIMPTPEPDVLGARERITSARSRDDARHLLVLLMLAAVVALVFALAMKMNWRLR